MLTLVLLWLLPQASTTAPNEAAAAKRVFDSACSSCHGPEGTGGKGPVLAVPKLRLARTDENLARIIRYGIPGTEMPTSSYLGIEGMRLAGVYVRMLNATATPGHVEGDTEKGKALFLGKGGCTACHTIGAQGTPFGPDLSDIGLRRSASHLRESITDPAAEVLPSFVPVRTVTNAGAIIDGVRVNEDNFNIQVREATGRLYSFSKSSLKSITEHPEESPMPSYKSVLSETEMLDLVSYLASQKGVQ